MKSTKYRKHVASRHEFPTVQGKSGNSVGHKKAQKSIEDRLGRQLKLVKKPRTGGNNWVFYEAR